MDPGQYAKFLGRMASERGRKVQRALEETAAQGARMARERTRDLDKVDTGRFAESWRAERREDGAAVVDVAPYAPEVDDGRTPGPEPSLPQLARWAERRLGVGGKGAWAAARNIARRIAERGTVGAHITTWLAKKLAPIAERRVEKALE